MQRVSNSMMHTGMMTDTYKNLSRLLDLNKQLSTGKLHHKPSDSPIDVTRELSLSTTISENDQYVKNMEDGLTWLKNSDTALGQIGDMVERVRELAVRSGSGALNDSEMEAIAQEMEQLQEGIMEAANYSVEGRHLLSGAATSVAPFQRDSEGHVVYMGNDSKVQYEMDRGVVSDVSFTGREVFPEYYTQYSLESVDVPLDFKWSGRNEIIQVQTGDRSVKIRIPEDNWSDNDNGYVANSPDTDYNRFRDPQEHSSMSLDDIAATIESSMNMGDAGRLVSVEVIKDAAAGTQRLQIRSHTGDPVSITSWPETDNVPMNQAVAGTVDDSGATPYQLSSDGSLEVSVGSGKVVTVDMFSGDTLEDMAQKISSQEGLYGKITGAGTASASLVVIATDPEVSLGLTAKGGAADVFGADPLSSEEIYVPHDQSHIDLMSLLGMETSLKSTEIPAGTDPVTGLSSTNKVHWYLDGGDHHSEVMISAGADMTVEDLATEIKAVAGDWLEVIVQTDPGDKIASDAPGISMDNAEGGTSRLILRSRDGGPVNVLDIAPDGTAGNENTQLAQSMGLSTAVYASDGGNFPTGTALDSRMPARMQVTVGDRDYNVKLYRDDVTTSGVIDAEKMMKQIQSQVGTGVDGEYLVQYKTLSGATGQPAVAAYSNTGEPISFMDFPFGDPALGDYSAGIATSTGISSGITGAVVPEDLAVAPGESGVFRVETMGHSLNVSVAEGDTLKDVAEKLEKYAGDWLNVAYLDTDLNDPSNGVQLSISSKDGSPVNIVDLELATMSDGSSGAVSALGISTGIRGDSLSPVDMTAEGHNFKIEVDGYEHNIDLRQLDLDDDNTLSVDELKNLPDLINSRFQGQDVSAELYTDNAGDSHVLINSPRGSSIVVSGDLSDDILGAPNLKTTKRSTGVSPVDQQVAKRSSSDYKKTDFFGLMEDLIDAVRHQDREGVSNLLGDIDGGIDYLLKARTEEGALVKRYEGSKSRLTQNNINYTELYSSIADTDIAKASMEYMSAQAVYQAGLASISKIIQPTLVDFLR